MKKILKFIDKNIGWFYIGLTFGLSIFLMGVEVAIALSTFVNQ